MKQLLNLLLLSFILLISITAKLMYLILIILILVILFRKKVIPYFSIISLIVIIIFFNSQETPINKEIQHESYIKEKTNSGYIVNDQDNNYFIMSEDNKHQVNDMIYYQCKYKRGEGSFLYYLKSKKTDSYCYAKNEILIKKGNNLSNKVYNFTNESNTKTSIFIKYLLFQEAEPKLNNMIITIGIYHLFVVSGFHISIFVSSLQSFTALVFKKKRFIYDLIPLLFVIPFMLVIGGKIPALRAYTYEWMIFINKWLLEDKNSRLTLISSQGIGFITFNPYLLFNISFILSFIISLFINLIKDKKSYKISFVAFVVSLPFVYSFQSKVNILTPLMTLTLTPFIIPGIWIKHS